MRRPATSSLHSSSFEMKLFSIVVLSIIVVLSEQRTLEAPIHLETFAESAPAGARFMNQIEDRIISGSPAQRGQFPHQVALTLSGAFCGGSLITTRWVLTAAHCLDGATSVTAKLGSVGINGNDALTLTATRGYIHAQYDSQRIVNDIAAVELSSTVTLNQYIQTIRLGSSTVGSGVAVTVSGWGKTSDSGSVSQTLNYVDLTTITNAQCAQDYGGMTIASGIVCCQGTGSKSTCQGDSGGPLITGSGSSAVQVGIVSFGSSQGCTRGYATAYTRVASYLDWINQVIAS